MGVWHRFIVSIDGIKPLASEDTVFTKSIEFNDTDFNYEVELELESCPDNSEEFILDLTFGKDILVVETNYCDEPIILPCIPKKFYGKIIVFRLRLKDYLIKIVVKEV